MNIKQVLKIKQDYADKDLNAILMQANVMLNLRSYEGYGIMDADGLVHLMQRLGVDYGDITWAEGVAFFTESDGISYELAFNTVDGATFVDFNTLKRCDNTDLVRAVSRGRNLLTLHIEDLPALTKDIIFKIEVGTIKIHTDINNLEPITAFDGDKEVFTPNPNGLITFKLKTKEEFLSKLRFVYEGGIYLDFDSSKKYLPDVVVFEGSLILKTPYFELRYER